MKTATAPSRLKIAVLFGGRSGEHEVSLMSARSVIAALDPAKYEIFPIGITHAGNWFVGENVLDALEQNKTDGFDHTVIFPEPDRKGLYAIRNTQHVKITDLDVV